MKVAVGDSKKRGLVYIFTGDGKGKTSAALGITVRMMCLKKRVLWVAWYKGSDWQISEMKLPEMSRGRLKMFWLGRGFYLKGNKQVELGNNRGRVYDFDTPDGHKRAAREALKFTGTVIKNGLPGWGIPEMVVMDEVVKAVADGLVEFKELMKVIGSRGNIHLVLTGRGATAEMVEVADLVSEIKNIKHPFDAGKLAEKGLDY